MFSRAYRAAITVPPLLWVAVFLLVPYALLFCYSFWSVSSSQEIVHSWTLDNYRQLMQVNVYWQTLLRSMWIAARVMIFSLLLGYPLAYYLSFHAGKRKELLYQLVIIPLWVSYLVRAYAWKTILGSDGVLNTLLQYVHLTSHPLDFLLYSPFAVVLTLTHIYTPFTFLPIYAALEHIPRNLVEASHDLGASPFQTFWRVIFPLSIPGVLAGATFAFVLSLGDFLAPLLLGGPSGIMISNIVVSLFGAAYNWPLGAAISFCMLALVLASALSLGKPGEEMELSMSRERTVPASRWLPWHAIVVFGFLYLPIVTLIVYSFNGAGVGGFPPRDLTLNWYRLLFADEAIWTSVLNSLLVAFAAMAISLTFGIPAALALDRANFPGKALFRRLVLLPLILPGIITGLSLLMLFRASRREVEPADHRSGPRHRPDFSRDHGSFRRLAETRSRAGGSVARSGRELLADLLARHSSQPAAVDHRRGTADLHALDGRNRSQFFPDRTRQYAAARNLGTPAPRHHPGNQRHFHHHLYFFAGRNRDLVPAASKG